MIQLTVGFMVIYFAILKMKIGVQDVISPYPFDQILIPNTPRRENISRS